MMKRFYSITKGSYEFNYRSVSWFPILHRVVIRSYLGMNQSRWITLRLVQLSILYGRPYTIGSNYQFLLVFDSAVKLKCKWLKDILVVANEVITRSFVLVSGTKKRVDEVASPRTIHDLPEHVLTCGLSLPGKYLKNKIFSEKRLYNDDNFYRNYLLWQKILDLYYRSTKLGI